MNDVTDTNSFVCSVLWRQTPVDAVSALIEAFTLPETRISLDETAIAIDSNVFLNLSGKKEYTDALDYLGGQHKCTLVLPGQSLQEFWNNHLNAVKTVTSSLKKKIDEFSDELSAVDDDFGETVPELKRLLGELNERRGHIYSAETSARTLNMIERLKSRAIVPYADRSQLVGLAAHRKITKTPPGFKDDGDGDFYIWADILTGLYTAKKTGSQFKQVALITDDKKEDWSRNGTAHPILAAEVMAILGVPFQTWSLKRFRELVKYSRTATSEVASAAEIKS
ncbi:MAG: PIN-like domain-containing protein [Brevundimonas sp.]